MAAKILQLERLLRPRSIAVFGGREARRVIEQCDKMGFAGAIWPVHPKEETILGRPCYRSVADLPEAPDAAFIGVNRHLTIEIVAALAERGAGGAVCYASGYREATGIAGSAALQDALVEAAGTMPIIGPNCYGLINALDGALLWPDQHGLQRADGGVAILTQSSNIAINISMQTRGLPIAYLMTAGNQAQTGMSRLATAALDDPRVTAIGLHIEGFDDIAAVEQLAARARALGKPVIALKIGRSETSRAATLSHTASLAGDDAVSEAVLARLGIGRVTSIPALVETLKLLHVQGPLKNADIASMSCSGGEASIVADAANGQAVRLRPLSAEQAAPLREILGDMVAVANPLDYHTFIWGDGPRLGATFSAMMAADFALTMLILDFPRADRCTAEDWFVTLDALVAASRERQAPAAIVSTMPETMPEDVARRLIEAGVAPLCGIDDAIAAAAVAAGIGRAWARPPAAPLLHRHISAGAVVTHDEDAAKRLLAAHGVPVPGGRTVGSADEAVDAAREIGYPVVLKALGIAHKTEIGGVRLALADEAALRQAWEEMQPLTSRFMVEAMATRPVAELIVGVTRDPVVGLVLTIGAGGIFVELLNDAAVLTLPLDRDEVTRRLRVLAVHRLLAGYRGGAAGDVEAVVETVMAIGAFAEAHAERIEELDVNPLLVFEKGKGVLAVDALLRIRGETA